MRCTTPSINSHGRLWWMMPGHTTSANPTATSRYKALSKYRRNSVTSFMLRLLDVNDAAWLAWAAGRPLTRLLLFDFLQDLFQHRQARLDIGQRGAERRHRRRRLGLRGRCLRGDGAIRLVLRQPHARLQHGRHVLHEEHDDRCGGREKERGEKHVFGHKSLYDSRLVVRDFAASEIRAGVSSTAKLETSK